MRFFSFLWDFIKVMFLPMLLVLAFLAIMYTSNMNHVVVHEYVHSKIYEAYDIESNISIDYVQMSGLTTVSGKDYAEKCAGTACQTLQEQNEIVSYNTGMIIVAIYGMGMLLLVMCIILFMQFKESNIINTEILKSLRGIQNG